MKKKIVFLAVLLLSGSAGSQDQSTCGSTSDMFEFIEQRYKESAILKGVSESGKQTMTLLSSDDKSTWTILVTQGDVTCLSMAGKSLRFMGKSI